MTSRNQKAAEKAERYVSFICGVRRADTLYCVPLSSSLEADVTFFAVCLSLGGVLTSVECMPAICTSLHDELLKTVG